MTQLQVSTDVLVPSLILWLDGMVKDLLPSLLFYEFLELLKVCVGVRPALVQCLSVVFAVLVYPSERVFLSVVQLLS